jgi:hypothetical protein
MIFYAWTALTDSDPSAPGDSDWTVPGDGTPGFPRSPVAMGITDDRGRAMRAGEETLWSGRANLVIIEAVRPGMATHTLTRCYVPTGVRWLGRCTRAGEVTWNRFFIPLGPGLPSAPWQDGSLASCPVSRRKIPATHVRLRSKQLGFAVHRPGGPEASPGSNGVPRRSRALPLIIAGTFSN